MRTKNISIVFPPSEFIKEEMDARGWNNAYLAEIMGCAPSLISQLVNGKSVTPAIARKLGESFGTSPYLWMNLQSTYDLEQLDASDNAVAKRARLYSDFPVKDMIKRGWIEATSEIEVLEKSVLAFFGISSLDEQPSLVHAARKSTSYADVTPAQTAWLFRAKQLAKAVMVSARYSEPRFKDALAGLKAILPNPEEIRRIPRILADAGVRLVLIESLPATRIDGVAFWLDKHSPVIALSFRYDRVDNFWFTLLHECYHVLSKHGQDVPIIDTDLVGEGAQATTEKPKEEQEADAFASEFLVKKIDLDKFIARIHPYFYKARIVVFAERMQVPPGIIVGQLHHRKELPPSHLTNFY